MLATSRKVKILKPNVIDCIQIVISELTKEEFNLLSKFEKYVKKIYNKIMTNKNKNFLSMGIVALASAYGLQAIGIPLYNEFSNNLHEMKMVSLYNKIWPQIDKSDVSQELKAYKDLAKQSTVNYKFGILPEKIKVSFNNKELPSADNVEESAKSLNKKNRLF